MLVHVRFVEYGWDWSGAFAPDLLGDTQLKVRNLVTGATQVLRVEVQNAAFLHAEFNGISATDNSLGTYMIFLSEDEGGFMPYRIDNFSVEVRCLKFMLILDQDQMNRPTDLLLYLVDKFLAPVLESSV